MNKELYIGLMSGTSMDGVDAVLVDLHTSQLQLCATHSQFLPSELKTELLAICQPGFDEINRLGVLDRQVGELFADTAIALLKKAGVKAEEVCAIGSHGQTVRHQPHGQHPFTLQIGDPNIIAAKTGITTVADFRRRDMAHGGQGAPLTPAFHNFLFRSTKKDRIILNLGGIANITYLAADKNQPVIGFDTGPANTLLDAWIKKCVDKSFDQNGEWAASGKINNDLLEILLTDIYFQLPPPKSTGREYFNLMWLEEKIPAKISAEDIQATLCEFTAKSIALAIDQFVTMNSCEILVAGGGAQNSYLIERLKSHCKQHELISIEKYGLHPQWIEAVAFAWFAQQTLARKSSNLPSVTGAKDFAVLGGVYY